MSQSTSLPARRDTETRLQLGRVLRPLLDAATDWAGLSATLAARGYRIAFADGRLLVRLQEGGGVWFLDPKVNCSWCWTYVDKTVWVKLDKRSATLLNPQGDDI